MLTRLLVENIALAEHVELEAGAGLLVITGETGAGKSLLVDALSLLLGGRGATELIRTGASSAVVEATFLVRDKAMREALDNHGVERDGDEVTLRRTLNREGRHRNYVNGGQVPAAVAAEIAELMLDIHGQHEQQSLLRPAAHLELLDGAAGLAETRERYRIDFDQWREKSAARIRLEAAVTDREKRLDFLRYQLEEIDAAAPQPGEQAALENERKRLEHADRLAQISRDGEEALYAGDAAAASGLRATAKRLEEGAKFDAQFQPWAAEARELAVRAEELARSLGSYAQHTEANPARLDALHARLDILAKLKRKHGDLDALAAHAAALRTECATLEKSDEELARLSTECDGLEKSLREAAGAMRRSRLKAAPEFARKIETALRPLGMQEASISWVFAEEDKLGPTGSDRVELMLSANRGEPAKALQRVASGGELSRVMLALHTVSLEATGPGCVIFDEIDAGIGGEVGDSVGVALRKVAARRQVICVTHLAQIAVYAQQHWSVRKRPQGERTVSELVRLEGKDRQEELGRMLGGRADEASRKHARALLERAGA